MTTPGTPKPVRPVEYKGEPLEAERGPGLGCFRIQLAVLVILLVLTPLTVAWSWNTYVSAGLLFVVILLLLLTGQTMIFLLRLVAAGRSDGRRRPLASPTRTVGELEDEAPAPDAATAYADAVATRSAAATTSSDAVDDEPDDGPRWPGSGMRE